MHWKGRVWEEAKGYLDDPISRQKAMKAFMLHRVNQLTISRAAASGNSSGPAGSGAKLRSVLAFKFRAYLSKEFYGAEGMLINDHEHIEFLTGPSMSIRGGTDEVQKYSWRARAGSSYRTPSRQGRNLQRVAKKKVISVCL